MLVPDPVPSHEPSSTQAVTRLVHHKCRQRAFRKIPPDKDAGTYEIGQDSTGRLLVREPLAGNTTARDWAPGTGAMACQTCWDGQREDNDVVDLETGKENNR